MTVKGGAVLRSGQPGAYSVTMNVIPPSEGCHFFKVFAKAEDEPPPDEGQDP